MNDRRSVASLARVAMAMFLGTLAAGAVHATVITAFPVDFAATEDSSFDGAVATFEDDDPAANPADFTVSIDWGDGTPVTPATTIGFSSAAFVVLGQHTYTDEGVFTATVTISDVAPGTGTATATDSAIIAEADVLSGTPMTFSAPSGVSFTTTVATFTDTLTAAVPGDFTATIDWGDATTSAGTVSGGGGALSVTGTHTYAAPGTFPVMVTLSDDAPGTATATVTSTAQVAAGLTVTSTSFATAEDASFNGTVANFSDANTALTAADFAATIDWGDGNVTAGTVAGGSGSFTLTGQHTFADEGSFTVTTTVTETSGAGASAGDTGTATVAEADVLSGSPLAFAAQANVPFSGAVATFTDADTASPPGDFTATIDWGDSNVSAGTVSGGAGSFTVNGTHTYGGAGTFAVVVTLSDDPPGTATAQVTSTADVALGPAVVIPALDGRGLLVLALLLAACALLRLSIAGGRG